MGTRNTFHLLSGLGKGQIYLTKDKTSLMGKSYYLGYRINEHDYSSSITAASIYLIHANLEIFTLLYTGITTNNNCKTMKHLSYPIFIFGDKTYALQAIHFHKNEHCIAPDHIFDCNFKTERVHQEPLSSMKIDDILEQIKE